MNIFRPISTHGHSWLKDFGPLWERQLQKLKEKFQSAILEIKIPGEYPTDVPIVFAERRSISNILAWMKEKLDYSFLADLTATDEISHLEVVYQLYSHSHKARIRFKIKTQEDEAVPSLVSIWPGANWLEREVYDMFGVVFEGHPHLTRILMHSSWKGHPLRKSYPLKGYQFFPEAQPVNPQFLETQEQKETDSVDTSQHTPTEDTDELWEDSRVIVNIGPTHPAMHGALRMVAKLNGETIEESYCEFGYTHRAKEKLGEHRTYHNYIVYTDRLNYCSALLNNVAYVLAVEKLMGIEVPERCVWLRMICSEIARVTDHLICIGINAVDLGAFSYFLYGFHQREEAYTLIEKLCGARLTTSYTRVGGLMADAPEGFEKELKAWVHKTRKVVEEMDRLLTQNKIWLQRTQGIGVFNQEQCRAYSFSGPNARAAGIDWDLRRDQPYLFYDKVEFDIPIAQHGDVFDRYVVRLEEIHQSLNILSQCADRMKKGPIWTEDKRVRIPEKERVYHGMEEMIHHFKFFMTGFSVPPGEAYVPIEASNGEMGFYIVSKGGPHAHRMRIRGPSVWHYQGLSHMVKGKKIADMVATLGSINIIAGELDR